MLLSKYNLNHLFRYHITELKTFQSEYEDSYGGIIIDLTLNYWEFPIKI